MLSIYPSSSALFAGPHHSTLIGPRNRVNANQREHCSLSTTAEEEMYFLDLTGEKVSLQKALSFLSQVLV
jgi:hypothetical protein